jgi:hypothetical protein
MCIPYNLKPSDVEQPALKGAKALASSYPASNASAWGFAESAADIAATSRVPTLLHQLARIPATISANAYEKLRHEQEGVARDLMPQGDSLTEQSIYAGLQSLGQNVMTLPLSILTGRANTALTAMAGMTFGKSYGEARDHQIVPKSAREQIEAALTKARIPASEANIRRVYATALERQRAQRDPGAAGP